MAERGEDVQKKGDAFILDGYLCIRAHRNKIGIMAQTTIKSNPKGSLAVVTNFSENMKSNAYFQSLPAWVQETIQQTAITLHSEEELRQCAEKLMQNGKN